MFTVDCKNDPDWLPKLEGVRVLGYALVESDYVRALGDELVERQPPRTQQLLGWYTRVVTSLDEYYQPAGRRLYPAGQG